MKHIYLSVLLLLLWTEAKAQYPPYYLALKSFPYEELEEASQLSPITIDAAIKDVSCAGYGNGAIRLEVSGGLPPYQFKWSNGADKMALQGLVAGQYTVTITDTRGAKAAQKFTIKENNPLAIDFIVMPDSNDSRKIEAIINGGEAPYQFQWQNGSKEAILHGVEAGTFSLFVSDKNQCTSSRQIELPEIAPFSFQKAASSLINIHPNPTEGIITIKYPDKFNFSSQVQLFDDSGQFLRQYAQVLPLTKSMEIDLTGLKNGLYFVRIEWGGQSVIKKVILQNN